MRHHGEIFRSKVTPKDSLQYLKEDNFLFINSLKYAHDHLCMIIIILLKKNDLFFI